MQKFLMALTTAALVSCVNSADAALIFGSQTFSYKTLIPDGSSHNLKNITEFTTFIVETDVGSDSFASFPANHSLLNSPIVPDSTFLKTFSLGSDLFGWFEATDGAETENSGPDQFQNYSRKFSFIGNFTPGTAFAGLPVAPANLIISFNQANGRGLIGGVVTLTVPEQQIPTDPGTPGIVNPEPASIAMFGTMCIPLALGAFRRRQKATQAAV